jgi:hypothetical protein
MTKGLKIIIAMAILIVLPLLIVFAETDPTCTEEKRLKETPETNQRWVNLQDKSHCNLEV